MPRHLRVEPVQGKATVCVGVRRSGKSTYLFQVMERLLNRGVPRRNILYLNFFDALAELGKTGGTIVTRSEEERVVLDGREIAVMPAWRFLFELDSLRTG